MIKIAIRLSLAMLALAPAAGAASRAETLDLPNIVALPATDLRIGQPDSPGPDRALRFATTTRNLGGFALDVLGVPAEAGASRAEQCVRWSARVCLERREAGGFVWHDAHAHWHFEGYATYELRTLDHDGAPDWSAQGLAAGGEKVSFCLMDTTAPQGASPAERVPGYPACTGLWQGISPGWADTYGQHLDGQQILLHGVPDGDYAIVVRIDPGGLLAESSRSDNLSIATVRLWGGGTKVTAL